MKRVASALALVMIVAPVAVAAPMQETISGRVIDTACYAADAHGPEEVGCTEMCLEMGVPASLLTDDGQVLVLMPDSDEMDAFKSLSNHAAHQVNITGTMMERDGLKVMKVSSVEHVSK